MKKKKVSGVAEKSDASKNSAKTVSYTHLPEIVQPVPIDHEVGVVGDIAAGCAQMDNACGGGRGLSIRCV